MVYTIPYSLACYTHTKHSGWGNPTAMSISHLQTLPKPLNTSLFLKKNKSPTSYLLCVFIQITPHCPVSPFVQDSSVMAVGGDWEEHQSRNPEGTRLRSLLSYAKIIWAIIINSWQFPRPMQPHSTQEIFFLLGENHNIHFCTQTIQKSWQQQLPTQTSG